MPPASRMGAAGRAVPHRRRYPNVTGARVLRLCATVDPCRRALLCLRRLPEDARGAPSAPTLRAFGAEGRHPPPSGGYRSTAMAAWPSSPRTEDARGWASTEAAGSHAQLDSASRCPVARRDGQAETNPRLSMVKISYLLLSLPSPVPRLTLLSALTTATLPGDAGDAGGGMRTRMDGGGVWKKAPGGGTTLSAGQKLSTSTLSKKIEHLH